MYDYPNTILFSGQYWEIQDPTFYENKGLVYPSAYPRVSLY